MKYPFPRSFDLSLYQRDAPDDAEIREAMDLIRQLWLLDRTLVSDGFDQALEIIGRRVPLTVLRAPTGSELFTWIAPPKWSVRQAWIRCNGRTICDYADHPLHLSSYSVPFAGRLSREELLARLNCNPDRPAAIPFNYHYYRRDWSFNLSYNAVQALPEGPFDVLVDTVLSDGALAVGECVLPGESPESVVLCAHLCHPGQVNDGLSGVAVGLALMQRLAALPRRRYTYRLVLCPENIGSIAYLSLRRELIGSLAHGIFLEMLGNKNHVALQYSKAGNAEIDRIAELTLEDMLPLFLAAPFRQVVCNDEINFDGPGIDCPTISLSRWPYPEYHTSDDNPDIISRACLKQSIELVWTMLGHLERNVYPLATYTGNVFLSRYDLYENLTEDDAVERLMLAFDGTCPLDVIAARLELPLARVQAYVEKFSKAGLLELRTQPVARAGRTGP